MGKLKNRIPELELVFFFFFGKRTGRGNRKGRYEGTQKMVTKKLVEDFRSRKKKFLKNV